MSTRYTPEPSQIDYHADVQAQRVARTLKLIGPGDVLAVIDSRITAEADPRPPSTTWSAGTWRSA
jgi:hypothetical protein